MSKVERDIDKRWEEGIDHHPKAYEIAKILAKLDIRFGDDYFCFKFGGDGDNGEHLAYLLSIYFESLEAGEDPLTGKKL